MRAEQKWTLYFGGEVNLSLSCLVSELFKNTKDKSRKNLPVHDSIIAEFVDVIEQFGGAQLGIRWNEHLFQMILEFFYC